MRSNSPRVSVQELRACSNPPAAVSISASRMRHCARPSDVARSRCSARSPRAARARLRVVAEQVVDLAEHDLRLRTPLRRPRAARSADRASATSTRPCAGAPRSDAMCPSRRSACAACAASPAWSNARCASLGLLARLVEPPDVTERLGAPERVLGRDLPVTRPSSSSRSRSVAAVSRPRRHDAGDELEHQPRRDVVVPRAEKVRHAVLHDAPRPDGRVLRERVRREAEDRRRVVPLVEALRGGAPAGARAASGTDRSPSAGGSARA